MIDTPRSPFGARRPHPATGVIPVAVMSVLLVVACATTKPPPEPRYYRLPPVQPEKRVEVPLSATLVVERLQAGGPYAERPIVYVEPDTPLVLRGYHYHLWALPPPELLQESLIAWIRETGFAAWVTRAPGASDSGRITGRILRLEREGGADSTLAVVELELGYVPPVGRGKAWSRIYQSAARPSGDDLHALVEAFGVALDEVYLSYLNDLSRSLEQSD